MFVKYRFLVFALFLAFPVQAKNFNLIALNNVESERDCFSNEFQSYDSWFNWLYLKKEKSFAQRNVKNAEQKLKQWEKSFTTTFSKDRFNQAKQELACSFIEYTVNNAKVSAMNIKPKEVKNPPVILYNRGGTRTYGGLVFGHAAFELFPIALQGFAIIASNYRDDEVYGTDNIDEVTALVDIAQQTPELNAEKIGVYGISRGGMTSFQVAKAIPSRIAAIATINGVTDSRIWAEEREGIAHNISIIPGYQQSPESIHNAMSPTRWIDKTADVPVLVLHARDDDKVGALQSIKLAEQLALNNRVFKLKIFEDGGHWLSGHREEARQDVTNWFKLHLR
ncbi:alpha/beta hydrolase family protein [Thalassotalea ganghwensis]